MNYLSKNRAEAWEEELNKLAAATELRSTGSVEEAYIRFETEKISSGEVPLMVPNDLRDTFKSLSERLKRVTNRDTRRSRVDITREVNSLVAQLRTHVKLGVSQITDLA